jgi:hypothetical protein
MRCDVARGHQQDDPRQTFGHIESTVQFSPCDVSPAFVRACPPAGILRCRSVGYTWAIRQVLRSAARTHSGCTLGLAAGDLRVEVCSRRPLLSPIYSTRYGFPPFDHVSTVGLPPSRTPCGGISCYFLARGDRIQQDNRLLIGIGFAYPCDAVSAPQHLFIVGPPRIYGRQNLGRALDVERPANARLRCDRKCKSWSGCGRSARGQHWLRPR